MNIRPHLLATEYGGADDDMPGVAGTAACTACSNEPFTKPDYRAKRHPRPVERRGRKWVRPARQEWVAV